MDDHESFSRRLASEGYHCNNGGRKWSKIVGEDLVEAEIITDEETGFTDVVYTHTPDEGPCTVS